MGNRQRYIDYTTSQNYHFIEVASMHDLVTQLRKVMVCESGNIPMHTLILTMIMFQTMHIHEQTMFGTLAF